MLDSNVKQLLNEQVNKEFYSAYLYLDFSNFYKSKGLERFCQLVQCAGAGRARPRPAVHAVFARTTMCA